ncbi:MAG: hypothetical protein ACU0CA_15265 [Paracoccaceae bacterium]
MKARFNRRTILQAIGFAPLATVPAVANGKTAKVDEMTPAEQIKHYGLELARLAKENMPDGYKLAMIVVEHPRGQPKDWETSVLAGPDGEGGNRKGAHLRPHQSPDWKFHAL